MQGLWGPGCCHPRGQPPAAGGCVRAGGQVPSPATGGDIAGFFFVPKGLYSLSELIPLLKLLPLGLTSVLALIFRDRYMHWFQRYGNKSGGHLWVLGPCCQLRQKSRAVCWGLAPLLSTGTRCPGAGLDGVQGWASPSCFMERLGETTCALRQLQTPLEPLSFGPALDPGGGWGDVGVPRGCSLLTEALVVPLEPSPRLQEAGSVCLEVLCPGRAPLWRLAWMNPRRTWLRAVTPAAG